MGLGIGRLDDGEPEARLKSSQVPAHRVKSGEQGTRDKRCVAGDSVSTCYLTNIDCVRVAMLWRRFQRLKPVSGRSGPKLNNDWMNRDTTPAPDPAAPPLAPHSLMLRRSTDSSATFFSQIIWRFTSGMGVESEEVPWVCRRGIPWAFCRFRGARKGSNPHEVMTEPAILSPTTGSKGADPIARVWTVGRTGPDASGQSSQKVI